MHPDPLFTIFGLGVRPYGLCIAVGIICCLIVFFIFTKKKGMPSKVQDFAFYTAIVAIALGFLGAKVGQTIYVWLSTGEFNFKESGISAMAGFIAGALIFVAVYFGFGKVVFKGENKNLHIKHFNTMALVAPICICIAHGFGRIGCLMAGCCHGAEVNEGQGGIFMDPPDATEGYYVPTQLYEAIFLFILFAVLTVLYFKRCNIVHVFYLFGYGIWRFVIEFFRTDDRGYFLGLYPSQWTSILFLIAGIVLLIVFAVKKIPYFFPKEESQDKTNIRK